MAEPSTGFARGSLSLPTLLSLSLAPDQLPLPKRTIKGLTPMAKSALEALDEGRMKAATRQTRAAAKLGEDTAA